MSLNLPYMKFFMLMAFALLGKFTCMAQADSIVIAAPLKTADAAVKEKAAVLLYPNPTKNKAELQLTGFEPGLVQLQIISMAGRVERSEERLLTNGKETVVIMFALPAGVHYVILKQKNKMVKAKMLVQ
jgi:Secretion system C-terminal sorting domain